MKYIPIKSCYECPYSWAIPVDAGLSKSACSYKDSYRIIWLEDRNGNQFPDWCPLMDDESISHAGCREVAWPSWEEWWTRCQLAGIPEFYALDHWNRQEAANPPWGKVGNWRAYVACVKGYWVKDGSPLQPTVKGNGAQSIFELKTVMAEKERLAVDLKDRYSSQGAMGATWSDQTKREDYRKLRSEIKGLQARIASMG